MKRGGGHPGKYALPAQGNVKGVRGHGAPDLPARHGGQPAGGPGRRSGACWGCDAGAQCIRAQTTVRPTRRSWCTLRLNLGQRPDPQTAAPGMLVPGALSPQRRSVHDQRRSRRAVAPMEKNAKRWPRLVVGSCPNPTRREPVRQHGAPRAGAPADPSLGLDGWPVVDGGRRFGAYRFTTSPEWQESVHTAPPPRGLADRRPTHPARFHHRAR